MTAQLPESELFAAARALFGSDIEVSREFLRYLQPSGAKAAFRSMAKKTHPDLNQPRRGEAQGEEFRRLVEAYELMLRYFQQREGLTREPEADRARRAPSESGDYYHQGGVPQRQLEIGRYLFYRGMISYRSLIEAVTWQRRQRPTIGTLARRWKWLTDSGVRSVLTTTSPPGRFGEKAVQLGLLNRFQVRQLIVHQRSLQSKFGQFFVERGYLTAVELEGLLLEQREHNRRFAGPWFP